MKEKTETNENVEKTLLVRGMEFSIAFFGIYFCYLYYGIMQEYMYNKFFFRIYKKFSFSHDYGEGKRFKFAFALVFLQAFITYLISSIKLSFQNGLSLKDHIGLGLFNTVSMLGSNTALNYVSYPVQALMKSSKILSVILVTFVVGGHFHSYSEVLCGVLITIGILIFNLQVKNFIYFCKYLNR